MMHPSHAISLASTVVGSAADGYVKIYGEGLPTDDSDDSGGWSIVWLGGDDSVLAEATVSPAGSVKVGPAS